MPAMFVRGRSASSKMFFIMAAVYDAYRAPLRKAFCGYTRAEQAAQPSGSDSLSTTGRVSNFGNARTIAYPVSTYSACLAIPMRTCPSTTVGRPTVVDGHVRMGIAKHAEDVDTGYAIVRAFPKFETLQIGRASCRERG